MKRVVISGMGMISPLALNCPDSWEAIKAGKSGVGKITRIDTENHEAKVAAEVKGFDPGNFMDKKEAKKMALFTQYAVAAAKEAVEDAGLDKFDIDKKRAGVILGVGMGGLDVLEETYKKMFDRGPRAIQPLLIPKIITNEAPGNVAIQFGFRGPCYDVSTACASGTDAIGIALQNIRAGACDVVLSGGTEAVVTHMGIGGFCRLHALSTKYNDTPEKASRPFDKDRDGFVMGEGAGILVLEELEHAKKRGAKIYAEVVGYANSCDANHLTAPDPEGKGASEAFLAALEDAKIKPEDIDYINAHGTSTPTNDPVETKAFKLCFGEHAKKLKISSTKSMTGHCLGAAGGIEAILSALSLKEGFLPATINLDEADPDCDLDYIPNKGIKKEIKYAMSDSLGFGGHNGVLIFKRWDNE